jgi:membrane protein insertase Oxa1/YidC/SpoIIIJ
MQEIQPKIKAIQEKYKGNKEKQTKAMMDFYKENKTNPFSGCLPTIFQLVFLIVPVRLNSIHFPLRKMIPAYWLNY